MGINSKIKIIYKYLAIILMFGLSNFLTKAQAENYTIEEIINGIDANVIFMRHALALELVIQTTLKLEIVQHNAI